MLDYNSLTIIALVLLIFACISIFIIRNLYIKNSIYESWILNVKEELLKTKKQIKDVDSKNLFEKDDDVGVVFSSIDSIIAELDKKINEDDQ